jgi:hypothetical protein
MPKWMCFTCLNNFADFVVTDGRCGAGITVGSDCYFLLILIKRGMQHMPSNRIKPYRLRHIVFDY